MKEALKYLQAGAIVPVDMETTILLVNALKEALAQPEQRTVQVLPLEFVEIVMDKEHLVGNPIVWAQWPNKEKNNG